ncbi:MAG: ParD-like family protein [Synergistaceae bacterium]|nr:ParD-like family protein [Synergistaceae bacterium]
MTQALASNKSIKISGDFYRIAKATAEAENRSIAGQVEFWAKIGRAAIDNPDLPVDFIRETLIAKALDRSLAEEFIPE